MSVPKRILVPTDFSPPAEAALDYAKSLAEAVGASLHVLHVMEDPLPGLRSAHHVCSVPAIREQLEQESGEQLMKLFTPDEKAKLRAETTAEWGIPHARILEFANTDHIDLIIMGTQGRGAILHALMGSVAERVVRYATCPVMTIRSAPAAVST
jgi:nucleotide-binding universal stress UspA family protein